MDTDKKERIEKNKKKYIWLHRVNISVFILALFIIVSRYISYPGIELLFIPVVIGFLIYSMVKNSNFLFYDNFYGVIFLISIILGTTNSGGWGGLRYTAELIGGYFVVLLFCIVCMISFFMAFKVLEWYSKHEL